MPTPIPPVASGTDITSAWGNAVADGVNEIQGDIYAAGQLAIPWTSVTSKPTTFAPTVHAHQADASGGTIAYADVTGKPASFAPSAHAASHRTGGSDVLKASEISGFDRVASGGTIGTRIFVGTTEPTGSGVAEGDIWIDG